MTNDPWKMVTISLCWENGFTKGPVEGLARLHFVEKWWGVVALEKLGFLKNVGNRCEIKRKMTKQEECWKLKMNDNDEKMLNTSENWWTKWRNYQEYPDFWCENDEKKHKHWKKMVEQLVNNPKCCSLTPISLDPLRISLFLTSFLWNQQLFTWYAGFDPSQTCQDGLACEQFLPAIVDCFDPSP